MNPFTSAGNCSHCVLPAIGHTCSWDLIRPIPYQTVYKWFDRFDEKGPKGLYDQGRRASAQD
ncbi:helix-turn-helix domain-containing protein [Longimonas halophila]|uniref:helix-turn-helix domain-containing protein n=1 Tax=Longimonas halophila TaxID=1469170 RepID=UPI003CCBBD39